jgi:hypothetical protein
VFVTWLYCVVIIYYDSIYSQRINGKWEIGSTVDYAVYVEFGTRFQAAQPYLRPGLDKRFAKMK